jgi:hypothetical protein
MFHDKPFVDLRLAIGELVICGHQPTVEFFESNGGKSKSCRFMDAMTGERIAFCFRDGSTFKVKTADVQDYIDNYASAVKN